ncbi:hypothetical protein ABHF33_10330 [Chitinibacter sp. FCG-7]|uniref:Carboxypeptidase regulatory-like domain-containing protein n=1 Tax=Chitinibacter mangrovi TaxID=3153927 RepID=A0AAU7F6I2_9NEIS
MLIDKYAGLLLCLSLVACGGGTSSSSSSGVTDTVQNSAKSVSGVAAYGMALVSAEIVIKGANGKTLTTTTDANGKWTVQDVSSLTAPMVIRAKGIVGGVSQELYSVLTTQAAGGVTANVTPLTTALLSQATGLAPAALFADPVKIAAVNPAKVAAAQTKLVAVLSDYMAALGIDVSKVDLIESAFEANNKGFDKLMDLVKVSSSGIGDATAIVVKDKASGETVEFKVAEQTKKLSKPNAETAALDLSEIRTIFAEYNAILKTKAGVDSKAFADAWDDQYLNGGFNKNESIADIRAEYAKNPNLARQGTLIDILGCTSKVCQLKIKWTNSLGEVEVDDDYFIRQAADGKWKIYGDQQLFKAKVQAWAHKRVTVAADGRIVATEFFGPMINVHARSPKDSKIACAKFYAKGKSDSDWTEYSKEGVSEPHVSLPWIYEVPVNVADELNTKIQAGGALYKVELFTKKDCSGIKSSVIRPLTNSLYMADQLPSLPYPSINTADFGTNQLRYMSSANLIEASISIHKKTDLSEIYPISVFEGKDLSTYSGKLTVKMGEDQENARLQQYEPNQRYDWADGIILYAFLRDENGLITSYRPEVWPVKFYTYESGEFKFFERVSSNSSTSGSFYLYDKGRINLTATAGGHLTISGWNGSWSHALEYRAIMLCEPVNTSKFVLLTADREDISLNELKGRTFEYKQGCGAERSSVSVAANGQITFSSGLTLSTAQSEASFSAAGLDFGDRIIYNKAYKLPDQDGKYSFVVVSRTHVKADAAKSYQSWWQ